MNAYKTFTSLTQSCESLIYKRMPYQVFNIVWDNIDRVDKYIYEDYDEYCIYDDYVDKGPSKKTNKKHRLKINKAIRYMRL